MTEKPRMARERAVAGHSKLHGSPIKRYSSVPGMLQFMKSIQDSKLDSYNVVSGNLASESKKSMDRLRALVGGEINRND